ncbi:MAG TPA: hypothetical protein VFA48_02650 [Gammaproteobacteria bacterium]|nr:hypothetical protein [Gammaproteobacteria bacterium]
MKRTVITTAALALAGLGFNLAVVPAARAGQDNTGAKVLHCHLDFSMSGWSIFYKTASGKGTVKCADGQTRAVRIRIKGGGLTVGKSEVKDGHGVFSGVYSINEIFGHYAFSQAHAGAVKEANAMALTKGSVSLALTGLGHGWSLGVDFGAFIIEPAGKSK